MVWVEGFWLSVPQQLPVAPAVFVDRDSVCRSLAVVFEQARVATRPAWVAVCGFNGVGVKSTVYKSYWDHPDRFADGAVRVKLGDAVHGDPEALRDAVGSVLVDLGVPATELPVSLDDRHKRLLTKTFPLSVLLVLEDVANPAQVEPFLLNSPGSAVVVVCRSPMLRLNQLGFRQFTIEPLEERFGVELFDRMLGPGWCAVEGADPTVVVRGCGGYPLAITMTAAQIAMTPEWEVPALVRRLTDLGLNALDAEAQEYVRDSFDRAYQALTPEVARAYRLQVGIHPGREFRLAAAVALLDEPADRVRGELDVLVRAQLVARTAADRYRVHDVAHWHARDCAERDDPTRDGVDAARRVIGWYLDAAVRYDQALSERPRSGARYRELGPHRADTPEQARAQALSWLEDNRVNLREAVRFAERYQLDDLAWQLCEALWGVCHLHGHYDDWITTHRVGVAAAARVGDPLAEMRMTSQLGAALLASGELDEAHQWFVASLAHARTAGDASGEQSALEWLGKVAARRGDIEAARAHLQTSWQVTERHVDTERRPRTFALLRLQRGRIHNQAGELERAVAELRPAVSFFQDTAETDNQAKTLLEYARALRMLDRVDEAATAADRARDLFATDGSLAGEADALELLLAATPDDPAAAGWRERRSTIHRTLGEEE